MPNGVSADLLSESSAQEEHDPMTKTLFLSLASVLIVLLGCQDPSKWYLSGYDNEQFIFKHDHKAYAAVCWQSFHPGQLRSDDPADCSAMLGLPGIGREPPEKRNGEVKVLVVDNMIFWAPAGDARPRFHLKIVNVTADEQ
jgi:hypothetical protein